MWLCLGKKKQKGPAWEIVNFLEEKKVKLDLIRKIMIKAPKDEKDRIELYASVIGFKVPTDEEWKDICKPDEFGNQVIRQEWIDTHLDTAEESQLETILKKLDEK